MDHDNEERPGWVRLPGYDDDYPRAAARARAGGVRRVRRASNWTAAALIAGMAAATGYFVHHQPAATAASSVTGAPAGTTAAQGKPTLSGPVATSGGSGVTAGTSAGVASNGKPSLNTHVATSGGSGVTIGPNGKRIYRDN